MSEIEKAWDFAQVQALLSPPLASRKSQDYNEQRRSGHNNESLVVGTSRPPVCRTPPGLGDFGSIWRFLGSDPSPAKTHAAAVPMKLHQRIPEHVEYTSDGGVSISTTSTKKLQWRDEVTDGGLTDVAPALSDDGQRLSKKQRKKLNRRKRSELRNDRKAATDLDSETDVPQSGGPAARASVHSLKHAPKLLKGTKASKHTADPSKQAATSENNIDQVVKMNSEPVAVPASTTTSPPKSSSKYEDDDLAERVIENGRRFFARYNSEPLEGTKLHLPGHTPEEKIWPVADPHSAQALSFLPASVRPRKVSTGTTPKEIAPRADAKSAPHSKPEEDKATETVLGSSPDDSAPEFPPATQRRQTITPKIIRSGAERDWAFLLKLVTDFYEDKATLANPSLLSNHSSDPSGIHVFVDASNIFIGFHDQLKRARGIPSHVRVPRVDMSFGALALLMERRRPVAKRVLAGSTPHVAAFDAARLMGYDCAILDKVYKARELTDRQRYFLAQDAKKTERRRSRGSAPKAGYGTDATASGYTSGENGSGGSYTDMDDNMSHIPTHAKEAYVEQGVDEILHLKILESIVDADEKPTTIVLATGDAAQAEYSQGFMVMVERALRKGWRVELVSWSANISSMYKRDKFRRMWGERFKIIELDDYAEELLDM